MSTSWPTPPPTVRTGAPRWAIALIALVTALLMVVGVFIVLTLTGGTASASEVTREPVNTAGANPFMPAVGTDAEQVDAPSGTGGTYRGDTPGLYGGTRDNRTCDAAKLTTFLHSHPGQAAAWAGVLGIPTSQIDGYVSTLTPVLLRSDTRVTNHGYSDGRATVISSVLQAGTAVFVDKYGSPVVRCYCGNPLTAPTLVTSPAYIGPTWVSFNQTNITYVQNTTTIVNNYTIVDPYRNTPFVRTPGYEPGFATPRDQDFTGTLAAPTKVSDGQTPGVGPTSGSSAPAAPEEAATCPDGTTAGASDVARTATGDLDADNRPDSVVLVQCGEDQQVEVIDAAGTRLSTLTPETPPGSPLPARFDPSTFTLQGTTLTTAMKVFGANDTESTGPSETQTWTWNWDAAAQNFVVSPTSVTAVEAGPTTTETAPSTVSDPTSSAPTSTETSTANAGN